MRYPFITTALTAGTLSLSGAALAQDQSFDFSVTDSDRPYSTPGYTFRVLPITVTDAASFSIDAVNTIGTIASVSIVDFIVFAAGAVIPEGAGVSFGTHASSADAVGFFFDSAPNAQNTTALSVGAAGPLTEGDYQLVVAPYDLSGTGGDYVVTLELSGVFSGAFPVIAAGIEELDKMVSAIGSAARMVVADASGIARDFGEVSLAARDSNAVAKASSDTGIVPTSKTAPNLSGEVFTWAEVTGFYAEERGGGDQLVRGGGLMIGADVAVGTDMVVGVALGHSQVTAENTDSTQDGSLTYIQPYLSYRLDEWHGTATLLYGTGAIDQSSVGGTGTADVTLTALTFEGGYDYALQSGLMVTPTVGLIHGRQKVEGTGGTLLDANTYEYSQGSLGVVLSSDGPDRSLFAGLHADYLTQDAGLVLSDNLFTEDGWTGRVELGGSSEMNNGIGMSTSVELSGLGGNMNTLAGGIRVSFTF